MAAHVAERARAKIPVAAPPKRHIGFVVVAVGSRAEPQIPIYFGGNGLFFALVARRFYALRPHGAVGPYFYRVHVANQTRLDGGFGDARAFAAAALVAHLGYYFVFAGQFGH